MTAIDEGLLDAATPAAGAASDVALIAAMVDVESAHLAALGAEVPDWGPLDLPRIAEDAAGGGNPVIPLVAALRARAPEPDLVHLGLTSQDVIDSALMLVVRRCREEAAPQVAAAVAGLRDLAARHRGTPQVGRTLGQHAAPTTAGLRLAVLADGLERSWAHLAALPLPLQLGGSVGTVAVLADRLGERAARDLRRDVAARLGLDARTGVWHVERSAVALLGAALATVLAAAGRLGAEVVQGTRPEIGELVLAAAPGEGGSSARPQKQNPVPAILLVAGARRAPGLGATLLAAPLVVDDRSAGEWHAEWQPLRELLRLVLESAALTARLVLSLSVHADRSAANLSLTSGAVHAERAQQVLAAALGSARADELVRDALRAPDFVSAIRRAAADQVDGETRAHLQVVTTEGGAVGLSDLLIDDGMR